MTIKISPNNNLLPIFLQHFFPYGFCFLNGEIHMIKNKTYKITKAKTQDMVPKLRRGLYYSYPS